MILHLRKCCPYGISKFQADILQILPYYLTTHHNYKEKLINDNTNIIKENKLPYLKEHKFKQSVWLSEIKEKALSAVIRGIN